ncbi:MAG: PIN domain-containing protein [Anaerolineales bacterium]|nr:PIN domain-containing protein [Anaerolineales bacterium]MCO5180388.1 PIN domain-containing protein [Promineifilum sp.]
MITYLLDVNLLLALSDPMHIHHEPAHQWFGATAHFSWATCPLTENGFVRIASHPNYPNRPGEVQAVLALLRQFCALEGHIFWPDDISLREIISTKAAMTHGQITDHYLLALAVRHGGKLATLDRRLSAGVVSGGKAAIEQLPA